MSSGLHKPPVAPKPKLPTNQGAVLSPHTPRSDGLACLSPGTARKVKPPVAPKPSTQKPTTAVKSKNLQQKTVPETPWSIGLLNSQNGVQQNKKPEWDYIIPICLCSQENCKCISTTNFEQKEKNVKTSQNNKTEENRKAVYLSSGRHDNNRGKAGDVKCQVMNTSSTDAPVLSHKLLSENHDVVKTLSSDSGATSPQETARLPLPHRTQGDETNAGEMLQAVTGRGQKNNCFGSEQASVLQHNPIPKPSRKPPPVPVQRKPRAAAPSHQEKVEDKREDTAIQEKREVSAKEVKMSSDGKGSSSLSVSVPDSENNQLIYPSARRACPPPAPTPRKKPFHPNTTKAPTSSVQTSAQDVQEEDLGSDMKPSKMEESAYRKKEGMKKKVADHQEEKHHLPSSALVSRPDLSKPLAMTSTTEERERVEKSIKKHRRHSSTSALIQMEESIKEQNVDKSEDYEVIQVNNLHNGALKEIMTRELPAPPVLKPAGNIKRSGSKLSKKKAKSFSSADILRSEGQKGNGLRKILELKLVKKGSPKKTAKGSPSPYTTSNPLERSAHKDQDVHQCLPEHPRFENKLSFLQTGVEQSVDGDDFSPGLEENDLYDNVPIYEEISEYENVVVGNTESSPAATYTKDRQGSPYDDENIYEEQEPYFSLVKNTHQDPTQTEYDSSVNEEVDVLSDTFSEDDTTANTSDEEDEDDSSSMSSKGDPEQPGEKTLERKKKKTKIQHIATEIMSSESVFVDVLKLLHVDFRNSVETRSRQHGKPVIEEHLLNQILYYLPQLYELNKDLLKELRQRVAEWNENSQIADIFLKKGPFLKMYSTYIREFDKNVALLEEQTKKNSAFGAVVKEFQASPRCANLTLSNYLLKPVQRIPQYQLLLTDYLKNLSEDSNDYKDTQAALALVKEVASHANDIIKHGDNFEKLIQVQSCLSGHHHEIVQPGRIFLKEGALMKLSRKVMQPRMFFLFNDALLYTVPVQSAQYKLKNMLSLAGMKVSKPSQEAYQNELNIESVERSFILSASSASERDEWLETISTAISEYTKKKFSFTSGRPPDEEQLRNSDDDAPLGSTAPIWIPDLRTTMCMICTCEFTLTWRRHHCRACGKVVCQVCSSNKYCLAYKKNQPARVCDQCFAILQQKSEMSSAAATGSRATFAFTRKQKKIPAALKEVSANTDNSSMSGYLMRSKHTKKQGKRLWFVIKNKVLYTYAASEDVAALESQPLLGFVLKADPSQKQQFKLYHQNTLYYVYKADDVQTAQRWISSFKEATVL